MVKDVIKDKKQQPRWGHCETTIKRVHETKAMPKGEAPGAKQKQQTPDCNYDPRPPCDVSGGRFV
jgi:hypothetical protein